MIDWKRRCMELAEVVNRHRQERMHNDMQLGWKMAKRLMELHTLERKAQEKFLEWWKCTDKKKREPLYAEYLELLKRIEE